MGVFCSFFHPKKAGEKQENYDYRLTNAVGDLLRVLGYRFNPYYSNIGRLPEQVDLLAMYVVQLNSRNRREQKVTLPLMLEALAGSHQLRIYVPRASGSADLCLTLREGILSAARFDDNFTEIEVTRFFRDALNLRMVQAKRAGYEERATLLLVPDQNLGRAFPELNVQNAASPLISLNNLLNTTETQHIRVARLRFSADSEAAHCVPERPEQGKYQGLYLAFSSR